MQPPNDDEQNRVLRINDLVISRFRFPLASVEFGGDSGGFTLALRPQGQNEAEGPSEKGEHPLGE